MAQKRRRWKRVLLWSVAVVIVIGISGLLVMNYAVNKMMDTMVAGLEKELEAELEAQLEAELAAELQQSEPSPAVEPAASNAPSYSPSISASPTPSPSTPAGNPTSSKAAEGNKGDEPIEYSAEVSLRKADAIKDKVTISEKATVSSILIGNLDMSDIKLFQEMASGGLSVEEKREARKVLLDKLSPEEYDKLIEIAKKYGLSQGRNYAEVVQEEQNAEKP